MFSSACLNNLFVTYYLELFLYIQKVDPAWFYIGQIVFMIWNSVNDPLFGWLSDTIAPLTYRGNRRLGAIRYGGWLWVVAFLYVWWIPGPSASSARGGAHFIFSLCFYDCMLTYVEVNHSALLAELSTSSNVRANANMYAAICAGLGSLSAFFSRMFWSRDDLFKFQKYCVLIGFLAVLGFEVTAYFLHLPPLCRPDDAVSQELASDCEEDRDRQRSNKKLSFFIFVQQLFQSQNFVYFSVVSLLQVFDCAFGKNFFSIFLADFSGNTIGPNSQGFVVSLSFVLPWVCTVFLTPMVKRMGVYRVIGRIFVLRIVIVICGVLFTLLTYRTSWLYLMVNRIVSECVCRLMPLVKSDLVDEDVYLHRRRHAMSASVIGSSEFISKSGQSLAPMLGYFILRHSEGVGDGGETGSYQTFWPSMSVAMVSGFVVLAQMIAWGKFGLHGRRLKQIREHAGEFEPEV